MLFDVKTALLPTLKIRFSLQHNHFEFLQQTHKFNSLQFCIENIVLNTGLVLRIQIINILHKKFVLCV